VELPPGAALRATPPSTVGARDHAYGVFVELVGGTAGSGGRQQQVLAGEHADHSLHERLRVVAVVELRVQGSNPADEAAVARCTVEEREPAHGTVPGIAGEVVGEHRRATWRQRRVVEQGGVGDPTNHVLAEVVAPQQGLGVDGSGDADNVQNSPESVGP
jgi:hypothetical protein